jgi:hypothetical protein
MGTEISVPEISLNTKDFFFRRRTGDLAEHKGLFFRRRTGDLVDHT